jgi:hypothetical protein
MPLGSEAHVTRLYPLSKRPLKKMKEYNQKPRLGRVRGKCSIWDRTTLLFYGGPPKPPTSLCSKKRALELLLSLYLSLGGGIPRHFQGDTPLDPVFSEATSRAVKGRMEKD